MPTHDDARAVARVRAEARARVRIESITPTIEQGRFPVKRVLGDDLVLEASLVSDGHDRVAGEVAIRDPSGAVRVLPLVPTGNDRFRARLVAETLGAWTFAIEAWIDRFGTWRHDFERRVQAKQEELGIELQIGAAMLARAADAADAEAKNAPEGPAEDDAAALRATADAIADEHTPIETRAELALEDLLAARMARYPDRQFGARTDATSEIWVEPEHARFSSWYEFFPRSFGPDGKHGTLLDAEKMLQYAAKLGFDTVYLPPIHPIGQAFRKGPNNTLDAGPDDPGSPWAIGSPEGGHTAVHPALGTLDDFDRFVRRAGELGLHVALDIAFQCSPDHPWVKAHPSWFRKRPDGTIQYAENPPKKYQDVYPFDFESDDWEALWDALREVFRFWIGHGVRVFRVDNPHTKPLPFWEWCVRTLKSEHPDLVFLAEAFTRPRLKYHLAKAGYTLGYTYFTWRRSAHELQEYMTELTQTEVKEYFRPSFWPNTPDILPEDLQFGGRPAFLARLVLATTLSSHYGIYGPAFELLEREARPGSGEYIDNEKYELKRWDLDREDSLAPVITRLNRIRKEHPPLQQTNDIVFHRTDNPQLLCYSKHARSYDPILVVVSLDPHHPQSGWLDLDLDALGLEPAEGFQVHDLLGEGRYLWQGARNFVALDPHAMPAQLFRLRRKVRTERDFDYFL